MISQAHLLMALWMATPAAPPAPPAPPAPAAPPAPTAPPASTPPPARATSPASPGKLVPAISKEMTEAIVAMNKALGLESWPTRGAEPCVDRGGQGITAKDVSADDVRKCAAAAVGKGFPELGKSYALAIPMASIGPITVIALGLADSAGWGAYSCDPERKCNPVKLSSPSKWGKRTAERQAKACADAATVWLPADANQRACPTPAK